MTSTTYGESMTERSRSARGWALAVSIVAIVAFFGYVIWANTRWANPQYVFLVAFFTLFAILTGMFMISGLRWRSFTHLAPAEGRILAIVPVFQEDSRIVHEVVWSLIRQTRPPDAIYVVDDGSDDPVIPFEHPLVTWVRQENAGKRHAQANVLRRYRRTDWDFIFTVDSDSVLDLDALEHLLRSMSWMGRRGKRVQAATGMIYTRNWRQNLITRMTDVNIASSCLQFASLRSWFGVQTPTSGAIALYRPHVVYNNLDDYLTSGNVGDDRRLSFYALLYGPVVRVNEAVVETHLPHTPKGLVKQRMRWSKSAFLGAPFVATNFRNPLILFFYFYPLVFAVVWPLSVAILAAIWAMYDIPALLYGVAFWWIVSAAMTTVYAAYRPSFTMQDRLTQWGLGLVFYPLFGLLFLRPAVYWAIATVQNDTWSTRSTAAQPLDIEPDTEDSSVGRVIALQRKDVA